MRSHWNWNWDKLPISSRFLIIAATNSPWKRNYLMRWSVGSKHGGFIEIIGFRVFPTDMIIGDEERVEVLPRAHDWTQIVKNGLDGVIPNRRLGKGRWGSHVRRFWLRRFGKNGRYVKEGIWPTKPLSKADKMKTNRREEEEQSGGGDRYQG